MQGRTHFCILTYQSFLSLLLGLRGRLHGCVKPEAGLSVLLCGLHICEEEQGHYIYNVSKNLSFKLFKSCYFFGFIFIFLKSILSPHVGW